MQERGWRGAAVAGVAAVMIAVLPGAWPAAAADVPPAGPAPAAPQPKQKAAAPAEQPAIPSANQPPPSQPGANQPAPGATGLPVPRFVSLKSDRVNMRNGPGTDYPTAWVYKRAGLPVEVIREFEGWRQVRDSEGATGWILQSFLSGRRTALIEPWELKPGNPAPQVAIRASDSDGAKPVVRLEAGVIAAVQSCDGKWCYVSVETFRGYIEQKRLWGVYPNETVK